LKITPFVIIYDRRILVLDKFFKRGRFLLRDKKVFNFKKVDK